MIKEIKLSDIVEQAEKSAKVELGHVLRVNGKVVLIVSDGESETPIKLVDLSTFKVYEEFEKIKEVRDTYQEVSIIMKLKY